MGIQTQQELDFEKQLADYKSHSELQRLNLQAGYTYVTEGTKAAFLLNGAAAVALMTFVGQRTSEWAPLASTEALALFAGGSALAVITLGVAYLSQSFYAVMNTRRAQRSRWGEVLQAVGVVTFAGSTLTFLAGLVKTATALNPKFSLGAAIGL